MSKRLKKILLTAALDRYYETVSRLKKGSNQEFYRISTIKKNKISKMILSDITTFDIASYRDMRLSTINEKSGKYISPTTVRLEMALLSNLFNIARLEWGCCKINPVDGVRKPKAANGRTRRLSKMEERKISRYFDEKCNHEAYNIFKLALETAMRQGEILGLKKSNVDLMRKVIVLNDTKNGDQRTIPLTDAAIKIVKPLVLNREEEKLFSYTSNGFKSAWRLAMLDLNITDLHFHDLRHESISRFVELGSLNLIEIASISGHRSMSMLKRYSHIDSGRLHAKINKGRKMKKVMFPSYPAMVLYDDDTVQVDIFDVGIRLVLSKSSDWMSESGVELLKYLSVKYSTGVVPPKPTENITKDNVINIIPISCSDIEKYND